MNAPENRNEKRIALWPGRNREEGSNQPYLTGRLTLEGKDYFVTLWKRRRNSEGQPVLSGDIKLAEDAELEI